MNLIYLIEYQPQSGRHPVTHDAVMGSDTMTQSWEAKRSNIIAEIEHGFTDNTKQNIKNEIKIVC